MDLRRQIGFIRTWIPLLIGATVVAAIVGYLVGSIQPKAYEAKATLIVGESLSAVSPDYSQLLVSQGLSATYAAVAETRPIFEDVITKLGLNDTADSLAKRVTVDAPTGSTFVIITVQDQDPKTAANIANAMSDALITASSSISGRRAELQQSIDDQLAATQAQITSAEAQVEQLAALASPSPSQAAQMTTLDSRLTSLRATYAALLPYSTGSAANLLSVVEPATPPLDPVSPRPLLDALIAAVLGLLVAATVAFAIENLNDSIETPAAVDEVLGTSTLGMIAKMPRDPERAEMYRLTTILYPRSRAAEAYRTLRSNVEFALIDRPYKSLLVTSSIPGEGKTVTSANLAAVFAQSDRKVILVDADLRRPGVNKILNLPNDRGLTSLLRGDATSVEDLLHATEEPRLRALTTGPLPPNPAELLASQRMRLILEHLGELADLVIIDSPPLQAVADAAILSSIADGTILVVSTGRGHRLAIRESRTALTRADARLLGVVLNRVATRPDFVGYYEPVSEPEAVAASAVEPSPRS